MNVTTIAMPPSAAREKLRAVRTALHRKADAEYQALEQGYKALANGHPLVNLTEAISSAPVDDKGRPRLAIASAVERQVEFTASQTASLFDTRFRDWRSRQRRGRRITVPMGRSMAQVPKVYALVPIVPPEIKKHHSLERCHVLFEVEEWASDIIRAKPDIDPYLLRHLGGDLWIVLGEWELTDLERAVMAGRRQ